jgi:hypothetical protein
MTDGAGNVQHGQGTVDPADAIAIGVIAYGVTAGVNTSLEVRDHVLVFFFVVTWLTAAARRLMDFRYGRCPAYRVDSTNIVSMIGLLALGTAPWFAINQLRSWSPDSLIWTPVQLPASLTSFGVILAITTVGVPLIRRAGSERRSPALSGVTIESIALNAALFLLSGSLVIGSLAGLWFALALRRDVVRTTTESDAVDLPIDTTRALTGETPTI